MATKTKKPAAADLARKEQLEKNKAIANLSSTINAAAVIEAYSKGVFGEQQGGLMEVHDALSDSIDQVWDGDLKKCEAMLLSQAVALQSIFTNLSRRAVHQDYLKQFDTYLRLALKAQSQSVRTMEALAEIKNPRSVAFVRQANIATTQQVNNGTTSRVEDSENQQNKLSGATYELLPDTRASQAESRVDQGVEALAAVDRADVGGR